ncbi:MAG TPA: Holliday junction resolvase RuvX [Candidatus Cloacimonadota bacterium]|nr:Holliday junction resolvase RuvX [Candidatus Cloacimonadota bacterium]HPT71414.1 Holliday junction resolvase RuvX [Candidatus Cloacimonadota bacterium]
MSRILAIDYGEKRIGLALSDPMQIFSKPYKVVQFKSKKDFIENVLEVIKEQDVELVVLGLPWGFEGQETKKTLEVRKFGEYLQTQIPVPLKFWDERLTTSEANAELKKMGYDYIKAREFVDAVAASLILRSYLENKEDL